MVYRYCDKLFIYGTLMSVFDNPFSRLLKEEARLLGPAYTYGNLYEIDGYPGAVYDPDAEGKIHGELYFLNASEKMLKWLDKFEIASPGMISEEVTSREKTTPERTSREETSGERISPEKTSQAPGFRAMGYGIDRGKEDEYIRSIISVYQDQFESKAWMYIYNRPVDESARIPGGDYIKFIRSKGEESPH